MSIKYLMQTTSRNCCERLAGIYYTSFEVQNYDFFASSAKQGNFYAHLSVIQQHLQRRETAMALNISNDQVGV
jgi:hypothetical protein